MRRKALERGERKRTIILWFAIRIQAHNKAYATSYEIAHGLGLSPSQKLRDILNECVSEGLLEVKEHNKNGRFPGRGYMLKKGTYKEPYRVLKMKFRNDETEVLF